MKNKIIITVFSIYLLLLIVSYVYCFPQSNDILIKVIFNSIFASLGGGVILWGAYSTKLVPSFKIYFNYVYTILPFMFSVPMIIASIISVIRLFTEKDFTYISVIFPTIVITFSSYKAFNILRLSDME